MLTVKENELFLQAFEKPTQIYRYLHMRSIYSPMFLQRNLSYMSGKKCTQQRKKAAFSWDAWLTQIKFRDNSQPSYTESLVLQFLGYMDEKNVEASAVNVDIHLMQNKNNNEKQKQMLHSITVDVNRIITNLQTITITREQLLQSTTATDKNCVIFMEISYIMPANNEGKGRLRTAKRLKKSYETQLAVIDQNGTCCLVDGEYELRMNSNNTFTPVRQFDHTAWQGLPDYLSGSKKQSKASPSLKFLLKWTNDECLPKRKAVSVSPSDIENQSVDDWCESVGDGVKSTSSLLSSAASTSSLSTSGVSSDMGSEDTELVTISNKKTRNGFTTHTELTDLRHFDECRQVTVGIVDFGRRITYTFKYDKNTGQQAEVYNNFACPWCMVNCVQLQALLIHFRLCHDRFKFDYELKENGTLISVSVNDQYNCLLSTLKLPRLNSMKRPQRRLTYTKVLVSRHKRQYKHITTFDALKDAYDDDFELDADDEMECYKNQRLLLVNSGHNRQYYRTSNALPYTHSYDFDNDSEGEHDPEWQRNYAHRQLNEFSDVNEGEKELLEMWNLYIMKHNIIGDCRMPFACESFVDTHGKDILQKNLYRNFILHLCNMFDFGLLSTTQFKTIVQRIQATQTD